jgi:hypothetical protein
MINGEFVGALCLGVLCLSSVGLSVCFVLSLFVADFEDDVL